MHNPTGNGALAPRVSFDVIKSDAAMLVRCMYCHSTQRTLPVSDKQRALCTRCATTPPPPPRSTDKVVETLDTVECSLVWIETWGPALLLVLEMTSPN